MFFFVYLFKEIYQGVFLCLPFQRDLSRCFSLFTFSKRSIQVFFFVYLFKEIYPGVFLCLPFRRDLSRYFSGSRRRWCEVSGRRPGSSPADKQLLITMFVSYKTDRVSTNPPLGISFTMSTKTDRVSANPDRNYFMIISHTIHRYFISFCETLT